MCLYIETKSKVDFIHPIEFCPYMNIIFALKGFRIFPKEYHKYIERKINDPTFMKKIKY